MGLHRRGTRDALETVYRPGLLEGKVFVVSGGGSGIGRGITYLLSRLGADVMICGRRQEMLDETAAGIQQHCSAARSARTP